MMAQQQSMMREYLYPMMVFRKNGVTYVPHYLKPNVYVSPGYALTHFNEYTAEQLEWGGCEKGVEMLGRPKTVVRHSAAIEPEVAALLRKRG